MERGCGGAEETWVDMCLISLDRGFGFGFFRFNSSRTIRIDVVDNYIEP